MEINCGQNHPEEKQTVTTKQKLVNKVKWHTQRNIFAKFDSIFILLIFICFSCKSKSNQGQNRY